MTSIAELDFETYSAAGYPTPKGAQKPGIFAVGAKVYAEHPSTEVLFFAYDLKDGLGHRLWVPEPYFEPTDLFDHIRAGKLIEAHNSSFEYWIWKHCLHERFGWPVLPFWQLRDSAAKCRANAWPGALEKAAKVSGAAILKDPRGSKLIQKYSVPQGKELKRLYLKDNPKDARDFYDYCVTDIKAEESVSALCPDLSPAETEVWLCTQAMNERGIALDMPTVNAACTLLDNLLQKFDLELTLLTGGAVSASSETQKMAEWMLVNYGVATKAMDADHVEALLKRTDLPPVVRRVLEIRQLSGSAGVKKLYAMARMVSREGRVHDLFHYHGARTGRDTGQDLQPQNLVKHGPKLRRCTCCEMYHGARLMECPRCGMAAEVKAPLSWRWEAVDQACEDIRNGEVERIYGDAALLLSGCIRGLFIPGPGKDFIVSDYSSIEAVVTAVLAGCQWRIDTFKRKECIYTVSASKITGTPVEVYFAYKKEHGTHHPDRSKYGKPNELANGFGGWVNGYRVFDDSDTFSDEQVKKNILAWREASPEIPELWGGQVRGKPWAPDRYELFGLEGAAIAAIQNPGTRYTTHGIGYVVEKGNLYCILLSGRRLVYHNVKLRPSNRWEGQVAIWFEGWNSNPKMGAIGWIEIQTYGGRLCENCLALGTPVLTDKGWKPIELVGISDKVYDGIDFVPHGGLLCKGVQACVEVDGVLMTPEHEVLTNDGWKTASQNPEPYRPKIRNPRCPASRNKRREEKEVGLSVRLWRALLKSFQRRKEGRKERPDPELRVQNGRTHSAGATYPRHDPAPGLCGMAVNESPLSEPLASGLEKLWRARHNGISALGGLVRKLLGRYGADLCCGLGTGPEAQRPGVRAGKLPVGKSASKLKQPAGEYAPEHPVGAHEHVGGFADLGYRQNHTVLPDSKRVAGVGAVQKARLYESTVYDIVNAGPRQRFVVLGTGGPFIVHNCVQATARDIMMFAVPALERAGYPLVLRVHDELVAEVPEGFGTIEEFETIMGTMPPWAQGWPVRAAGGWRGKRYRKD